MFTGGGHGWTERLRTVLGSWCDVLPGPAVVVDWIYDLVPFEVCIHRHCCSCSSPWLWVNAHRGLPYCSSSYMLLLRRAKSPDLT